MCKRVVALKIRFNQGQVMEFDMANLTKDVGVKELCKSLYGMQAPNPIVSITGKVLKFTDELVCNGGRHTPMSKGVPKHV